MEIVYRFDERSYDALAVAGVNWREVQEVLRARPQYRQHIGAVLRVAARSSHGRWIGVALIEEADDEYLVVGGRELDVDEAEFVAGLIEGGL